MRSASPDESPGSVIGGLPYRAHLLDPAADLEALAALRSSGRVREERDLLEALLGELWETRHPAVKSSPQSRAAGARELLRGRDPEQVGRWVFYPWSGVLLRILEEADFFELRTSRNQNRITQGEQRRLRGLTIGVVGLSVGRASVMTLVLEGIGRRFHLADHDLLELSNLNRLHARLCDLAIPKVVSVAREIAEIDPFVDVDVFPEGARESNLDALLDGIDLLIEECDEPEMKLRLRERARAARIPVVMETSDRGTLDVERFDLEPARPPLHGLVGDLRATDLRGLSTREKVPVFLKILGTEALSPRLAASLVDIETTLRTWPQLASAVALGGALNAEAVRRIALGQDMPSGRFCVDLEQLLGTPIEIPPGAEIRAVPGEPREAPPPLRPAEGPVGADEIRSLVAYATLAPSGGNCQPWRFVYDGGVLHCIHDRARSASFLDFEDRASHLAFGAVAETLSIAASAMGLAAHVEPDPHHGECLLHVSFERTHPPVDPDATLLALRVTNRRRGGSEPIAPQHASMLIDTATRAGADLALLRTRADRATMGDVIGRGDRLRFLSERMHREMMSEVRWTPAESAQRRDGIDLATLELDAVDCAAFGVLRRFPVMRLLSELGAGDGLGKSARDACDASCALGLLRVEGEGPAAYLRGGRALLRLWLRATALDLAFQPMTALVALFARAARGQGLSSAELGELAALRRRWDALIAPSPGSSELMLFRLAYAGPPTARSLRRRVDDVLELRSM